MRRLPGPAGCRLGEGVKTPEAHYELFAGLAENTNSIICGGSSKSEAANGCLVLHMQTPRREAQICASRHPDQIECALSQARPETSCLSLDFHLYECWTSACGQFPRYGVLNA